VKIAIFHNIMWTRYRASVFSVLQQLCDQTQDQLTVFQIAESTADRAVLSPVDLSWHKYNYRLLFKGPYGEISRLRLYSRIAKETWLSDADVTILSGYDRPEYWIQALILLIRNRAFACFCDSTIFDNRQTFFKGLLKRLFFRMLDGVFCYGRRAAEYAAFYGASPETIISSCHSAALPQDYRPEVALAQRCTTFSSSQSPRYLYVGRLSPEKSIDHLLRAFALVQKVRASSRLIIVGKGSQEAELRQLAQSLGVADSVEFAGSKFDQALIDEYLRASCLILPSHSEPWGLVVNEALSFGCPVIVSNRCGCAPELAANFRSGFGFEWGDLTELSEKMNIAPDAFSDVAATANYCIRSVQAYTPAAAASDLLEGFRLLHRSALEPHS
jgi:glycosyltransferase involved in cell wall biosynthesis